jgi:hypothetical protein
MSPGLECSQRCYAVNIWPGDFDLWPWKSIRFQNFVRTNYVPSLVKIYWRMLILHQVKYLPHNILQWILTKLGTYLVLRRVWNSVEFQCHRSKVKVTGYVQSLVKIHWRMLILAFTRMLHGNKLTQWPWPLTYDIEIPQNSRLSYFCSRSKVKGSNIYRITSLWTL